MRAAFYESMGPARDVLRVDEFKTPDPGPGEVRVRLHTSGVNPSDVKSRGLRKLAFPRVIPHSDGAGEIDAVGDRRPEVTRRRTGVDLERPVAAPVRHGGGIHRAAGRRRPCGLPDNASFEDGACLGIPAMTAYHAIELAGADNNTTLLVSGGAGSVSQYAIQFAKARGATVITTISSPDKANAAREAGADHCIDYKREDVGERVAEITGKRGVDAIIEMDLTANAKLIPAVLRPRAASSFTAPGAEATIPAFFCLTNSVRLQFFLVYQLDAQSAIARWPASIARSNKASS